MAFVEDFAEFTDTADFGVVATVTRLAGVAVTGSVDGIFRRPYQTAVGVESSEPMFACAAVDLPGVKHGDLLAIAGVAWRVCGVQPDGTGWVRLALELAP